MFARISRLRIFVPPDVSADELDNSFEDATGKDCDIAAMQLSAEEFRRAVAKAIQIARKKKTEQATIVA
jgi:hypothetical protein